MKKLILFIEKHCKFIAVIYFIIMIFLFLFSVYSIFPDGLENVEIDSDSFVVGVIASLILCHLDSMVAVVLDKFKSNKD